MNWISKQNFMPLNLHTNYAYPLTLAFFLLMLKAMLHYQFPLFMMILISFMLLMMISYWSQETLMENNLLSNNPHTFHFPFKASMLLFILSEVLFFLAFFWSLFHFKLIPDIPNGLTWFNIIPFLYFNPMEIPLMNTMILLSSGVTLTISHFKFFYNKYFPALIYLILTVILGLSFSLLQMFEYKFSPFSMNDNIYSNMFFFMTGFHGLHVQVGTLMLLFNLYFLTKLYHNSFNITSFELASWYWHFVDIIWLFLFSLLYQ